MSNERINLFILTGFLGAGKTSLLNSLLADPTLKDTAVIVNEFGDIGLDHQLVQEASGDVILLDSGCLCCAAGETFSETLLDLWIKRQRGELPSFSRVVVETSGLAVPLPLIATVLKNTLVAGHYRMAGVITVFDSVFGIDSLRRHSEAREQLSLADIVVMSKGDQLGAQMGKAIDTVTNINPRARLLSIHQDGIDPTLLLGMNEWSVDAVLDEKSAADHHYIGQVMEHSLAFDQPLDWTSLSAFNHALKTTSEPLLRCKGLFNIKGEKGPVLLQAVRNLVNIERLGRWPDDDRKSRLVLIFERPPANIERLVSVLGMSAKHPGTSRK